MARDWEIRGPRPEETTPLNTKPGATRLAATGFRRSEPARSVKSVFEDCGADASRLAQHQGQLGDDVERVPAAHHSLEVGKLFVQPLDVDRRPRSAKDLRM